MFHRPKQEDTQKTQKTDRPAATGPAEQQAAPQPKDSVPQNMVAEAEQAAPPPAQPAEAPSNNTAENSMNNQNDIQTNAEESTMGNNEDQNTTETQHARPAERPFGNMQNQASAPQRPRPFPAGSNYSGAASTAYMPAESYNSQNDARKLIIGEGINMSGEIDCCDHLIVEGSVEASLKGANLLEISESGVFYGTVEIDEAMIAGRFEGDLVVNGRLTIRSTGSVTGSITYKEFAVEAGAMIDGKISPMGAPVAKKGKDGGKTKAAPRNDNQGSELPFAGSAAEAAE